MNKEKKKFKDTKLGAFLKEKAPKLLDKVADFLPDKGALGILKNIIDKDPEVKAEIAKMTPQDRIAFDKLQLDFEIESHRLENEDRASARGREIEYVKAGKRDWMMIAAGSTALGAFIFIVVVAVYKPDVFEKNPVLHQIVGMVEGIALSVFGYYYSTTKSSGDKTKMIEKMMDK